MTTAHLTRDLPTGEVIAIDATDERGYFSVTASIYGSRRAYGINAEPHSCGCLHDEILKAAPELEPLVAMHLSDLDGVPSHAESNARYRLDPAGDFATALKQDRRAADDSAHPYRYGGGHRQYYQAPNGVEDPDGLALYILELVSRSLRVDIDDLPDVASVGAVSAWIDTLRPRWKRDAERASALLEELASQSVEDPGDESTEEWSADLAGLSVNATCTGEDWTDNGGRFEYSVRISGRGDDGKRHIYRAKAWGSLADFDAGKYDARGLALMTLRELHDVDNDPDEYLSMMVGGDLYSVPHGQVKEATRHVERIARYGEAFSTALATLNVDGVI
jgi:hypothetical protein